MRVKVGDTWYECEPGRPIMVEFEPQDKINVQQMAEQAKRYAIFHDSDSTTREEKFEWMSRGARD